MGVSVSSGLEFLEPNPVSFTPGFSQVNSATLRLGNRLNGFCSLLTLLITRLKPGVNENLAS